MNSLLDQARTLLPLLLLSKSGSGGGGMQQLGQMLSSMMPQKQQGPQG